MCLIVTVKAKQSFSKSVKSIVHTNATLASSKKMYVAYKSKDTATLSLDEGCACSMLTEDADWNDQYWSMENSALDLLAMTIEQIAKNQPDGFTFQALWIGEMPKKLRTVSLQEMIKIIHAGHIETRTCYDIRLPQ